jgi:predicted nuclease of restriction endonuclease-like (RecB) superfamily
MQPSATLAFDYAAFAHGAGLSLSKLVREITARAKAAKDLSAAPSAKLAQAVREMVVAIPWGHRVNLLARIAKPAQRLFYLQATARFGGSRNVLLNQIAEALRASAYVSVAMHSRKAPSIVADKLRAIRFMVHTPRPSKQAPPVPQ